MGWLDDDVKGPTKWILPGFITPTIRPNVPGAGGGGGGGAGSVTIPGVRQDYQKLAKQNPGYAMWLMQRTGREGSLASNRKAALRQLAIKYGMLPKDFKDAYGDLTPADLADEANNFSAKDLIEKGFTDSLEAMKRSLAARGMLESGETVSGTTGLEYAKAHNYQQALEEMAAAINNSLSEYTGGMQGIAGEEPGLIDSAMKWAEEHFPSTPDSQAAKVQGSESQYGFPVYKDSSGGMWRIDANGNPVPFVPGATPLAPANRPPVVSPGVIPSIVKPLLRNPSLLQPRRPGSRGGSYE